MPSGMRRRRWTRPWPHAVPGPAGGVLGWVAGAAASGVFGMALGAAIIPLVGKVLAPLARGLRRAAS